MHGSAISLSPVGHDLAIVLACCHWRGGSWQPCCWHCWVVTLFTFVTGQPWSYSNYPYHCWVVTIFTVVTGQPWPNTNDPYHCWVVTLFTVVTGQPWPYTNDPYHWWVMTLLCHCHRWVMTALSLLLVDHDQYCHRWVMIPHPWHRGSWLSYAVVNGGLRLSHVILISWSLTRGIKRVNK